MAHDYAKLIQKADMELSSLTSNGGVLQPAQAAKFIAKVIKRATVMPMADTITMKAPKQLVEKIGFTSRVMRAGAQRTALSAAERARPVTEKVELDAKYLKAEVRLDVAILEDSIERGALRTTIMNRLLDAIPRDLDELVVNGDTTSSDTYLATMNGFIKQGLTNIYDANDSELDHVLLKHLFRKLPVQYRRDKSDLVLLTSSDAEIEYRSVIAGRQGAVADSYLMDDKRVQYQGIPLTPADVWPGTLGEDSDQTVVLLTARSNMKIGIWRQISIKTDEDISSDEVIVVVTLRMDAKFQEEEAVAKATEVRVPLAA